MLTFNNDKKLKSSLLKKLKHHQKLDTFVQGSWLKLEEGKVEGNGFRGCFYGCTMQTNSNAMGKFSEKYHIDRWFTDITEKIFEGLEISKAKKFPVEIIKSLPVGLDLDSIKSEFHKLILVDQLKYVEKDSDQYKAINQCIELFSVPFNEITWSAAESAESAAESAAWTAARSAARSAAWSARSAAESAKSAAWSAKSAAESAKSAAKSAAWSAWTAARSAAESAESAARSAAESAAKQDYYEFLKEVLIQVLSIK